MTPLRQRAANLGRRAVWARPVAVPRPAVASFARRFESTTVSRNDHHGPDGKQPDSHLAKHSDSHHGHQLGGHHDGHGDHGHDEHHEHHEHNVKELLGAAFWAVCATIPTWMLVYHLAQPDAEGNLPAITQTWARHQEGLLHHWKTQNDMANAVIQEVGHERHLLYYAPRPVAHELTYPEVFDTGSKQSVPAGHYVNLDKVKAHYRQKYMEEEERKAMLLAEKAAAEDPAPEPAPEKA